MRADGVDLVDEVLNTDDTVLAENLLDELVVGQRDALLVDFEVSALVDELADCGEVRVTPSVDASALVWKVCGSK